MKNKILIIFLTMIIVLTLTVPTFAHKLPNSTSEFYSNYLEYKYLTSEEEIKLIKQIYQEIIDKLNREYGTEVRFCTEEEIEYLKRYTGDENFGRTMNIPLDEYEETLRISIEESIIANVESIEALSKYNEGDFTDWKPINKTILSQDTKFYNNSQKVTGATAHLEAVVGLHGRVWKFNEINNTYTTYVPSVNGNIGFAADTYGYSLQNQDTKCNIIYKGYTFDIYGSIIDINGYRNASFIAF